MSSSEETPRAWTHALLTTSFDTVTVMYRHGRLPWDPFYSKRVTRQIEGDDAFFKQGRGRFPAATFIEDLWLVCIDHVSGQRCIADSTRKPRQASLKLVLTEEGTVVDELVHVIADAQSTPDQTIADVSTAYAELVSNMRSSMADIRALMTESVEQTLNAAATKHEVDMERAAAESQGTFSAIAADMLESLKPTITKTLSSYAAIKLRVMKANELVKVADAEDKADRVIRRIVEDRKRDGLSTNLFESDADSDAD